MSEFSLDKAVAKIALDQSNSPSERVRRVMNAALLSARGSFTRCLSYIRAVAASTAGADGSIQKRKPNLGDEPKLTNYPNIFTCEELQVPMVQHAIDSANKCDLITSARAIIHAAIRDIPQLLPLFIRMLDKHKNTDLVMIRSELIQRQGKPVQFAASDIHIQSVDLGASVIQVSTETIV